VSTPVSWDEVGTASDGDAASLAFTPDDVLARIDELGDLYAASLTGAQELPDLG
jgi:bifunctional non-homologous end joining protein LigD